jgi:hypothetical protein
MTYPPDDLLRTLARRVLHNLEFINGQAPDWHGENRDDPPYEDTQLIMSLLGVLVFPHEQSPAALGALLEDFDRLDEVIDIKYQRDKDRIVLVDENDETTAIDVKNEDTIRQLPRILRNCIAHFNVRPLRHPEAHERFGGLRVWNRDLSGKITFIGDIHFDQLRGLAKHILCGLADGDGGHDFQDQPDPLEELHQGNPEGKPPKAPKIVLQVWEGFLALTNGDADAAKQLVDRELQDALNR